MEEFNLEENVSFDDYKSPAFFNKNYQQQLIKIIESGKMFPAPLPPHQLDISIEKIDGIFREKLRRKGVDLMPIQDLAIGIALMEPKDIAQKLLFAEYAKKQGLAVVWWEPIVVEGATPDLPLMFLVFTQRKYSVDLFPRQVCVLKEKINNKMATGVAFALLSFSQYAVSLKSEIHVGSLFKYQKAALPDNKDDLYYVLNSENSDNMFPHYTLVGNNRKS